MFEHKNKKDKHIQYYKIIDENINIKKIDNLGLYLKQDNFKKIMVNIESLGEDWLMLDQVEFEF